MVTLEDKWRILVGEEDRPTLNDTSEKEEVCREIDWIQSRLIQLLNKETKKITICTRSKRWWNEEIRTCQKEVGKCKPGSLVLTRMAVGRDGWSEEVTEVFIGRRRTNSNAYG